MEPLKNEFQLIGLYQDMLGSLETVKNFKPELVDPYLPFIQEKKRLMITGEGSSRIFPAKNVIYKALSAKSSISITTEGATQAMEYDLSDNVVFGVSNSGKTNEVVRLFKQLQQQNHLNCFALVANAAGPLEACANKTHLLGCGSEYAVAATKSVLEQALFFQCLFQKANHQPIQNLDAFAQVLEKTITSPIDSSIVKTVAKAETVFFAGRNNGVAEELTLKTNEIIRKKSGFLEGTYAIHGIEEVMTEKDVVILIDPFEGEEANFKKYLADNAGVQVIAISSKQSLFPTIICPDLKDYDTFLQLATGWRLLLEVGVYLGINVDKPVRARKIGNEFSIV